MINRCLHTHRVAKKKKKKKNSAAGRQTQTDLGRSSSPTQMLRLINRDRRKTVKSPVLLIIGLLLSTIDQNERWCLLVH